MAEIARRKFMAASAAVAAGAIASIPIVRWGDLRRVAEETPYQQGAGILVIVTMYGGNDGINTVIPYSDNAYHDARPDLAYAADEVLHIDERYGFNPGMPGMADTFNRGRLAIIRGVGYRNPDRSHFRSMDIWQSSSLDNTVRSGWIGRWLDANGRDPVSALHMGPVVPPLAAGEKCSAAAFITKPTLARGATELITALCRSDPADRPAMTAVCDSYRAAARTNHELAPVVAHPGGVRLDLDDDGLASQLDAVAVCIAAGVPARVYSVATGGFDTHADERDTQQELLSAVDSALTRFLGQISTSRHHDDVVVMAYSEFGRRVAANSSDGTDHGTSGPVFVIGERVKGGYYGDDPALDDLVDGDLKVTTDFRHVYHELLAEGLHSDPEPVVGRGGSGLGFLTG